MFSLGLNSPIAHMKFKLTFLFFCSLLQLPFAAGENNHAAVPKPGSYTVYLFLGDECVISQQYTLLIRRLYEEFGSDEISFVGLFPNPSSDEKKIENFKEKYGLAFELKHDALQHEMDRFGVKVTPEVVVFQHGDNNVVYQGRIDNTFYRVGKRRTITTTSELEDVLKLIKNKSAILPKKTEAVGCYITQLDADLKNVPMCKSYTEQK